MSDFDAIPDELKEREPMAAVGQLCRDPTPTTLDGRLRSVMGRPR
jgi:hypothetical protein